MNIENNYVLVHVLFLLYYSSTFSSRSPENTINGDSILSSFCQLLLWFPNRCRPDALPCSAMRICAQRVVDYTDKSPTYAMSWKQRTTVHLLSVIHKIRLSGENTVSHVLDAHSLCASVLYFLCSLCRSAMLLSHWLVHIWEKTNLCKTYDLD